MGIMRILRPKWLYMGRHAKRTGISYRTYGEAVAAYRKALIESVKGHSASLFAWLYDLKVRTRCGRMPG